MFINEQKFGLNPICLGHITRERNLNKISPHYSKTKSHQISGEYHPIILLYVQKNVYSSQYVKILVNMFYLVNFQNAL